MDTSTIDFRLLPLFKEMTQPIASLFKLSFQLMPWRPIALGLMLRTIGFQLVPFIAFGRHAHCTSVNPILMTAVEHAHPMSAVREHTLDRHTVAWCCKRRVLVVDEHQCGVQCLTLLVENGQQFCFSFRCRYDEGTIIAAVGLLHDLGQNGLSRSESAPAGFVAGSSRPPLCQAA